MISKEYFCDTIKRLEELDNKINKVDSALRDICQDFNGFQIPEALNISISLLANIFKDNDEWLEYFIFELDWLKKLTPHSIIYPDGTSPDIKDWGDVYDFLQEMMKETDEQFK